jgi:hypothetical protein
MPKINGKPVDPKAYAARKAQAQKRIAAASPETKAKLKEFYPDISNQELLKSILGTRTDTGVAKKMKTVNKMFRSSK